MIYSASRANALGSFKLRTRQCRQITTPQTQNKVVTETLLQINAVIKVHKGQQIKEPLKINSQLMMRQTTPNAKLSHICVFVI